MPCDNGLVRGGHAIIPRMLAIRNVTRSAVLCGMMFGLCVAAMPVRATSKPSAPDTTNTQVCDATVPNQVRLQVNVSGMHSDKGTIVITIYPDQADHFLDGKYKVARQKRAVTLPVTHACFVVSVPGYYAVALFHDKNGNHHFDTNWLGIPVEGYGFSRNPRLFFGPPDLSDVRVAVHVGDNPIQVEMQHY